LPLEVPVARPMRNVVLVKHSAIDATEHVIKSQEGDVIVDEGILEPAIYIDDHSVLDGIVDLGTDGAKAEASTDARPTKRARKRSSKVSTAAADIDIEGDVVSEKDEEWIPGPGKQLKIGRKKKQEETPGNVFESMMKVARAKKAKEPKQLMDVDKATNPGKKLAAPKSGAAKAKKPSLKDQKCKRDCRKGPKSGCPVKTKRRVAGHVSCVEIHDMLKKMGISNPEKTSKCVKAAIMFGHIKITGVKEDLDQVILEGKGGECGHTLTATLGDLLNQPDYGGNDYEDGLQEATVICKDEACAEDEEGFARSYVTGICTGNPSWDCGKFHNHCGQCPGYGMCVNDYRVRHCKKCGTHPWGGNSCDTCERRRSARGFGGLFGRRRRFVNDCSIM